MPRRAHLECLPQPCSLLFAEGAPHGLKIGLVVLSGTLALVEERDLKRPALHVRRSVVGGRRSDRLLEPHLAGPLGVPDALCR